MIANSRTANSFRNSAIGLISQLSCTIINFIVRTVFIYTLNNEYLGVNGLFTNILTLLNFAELGIGNAIIYSMYKPVSENDQTKIKALMNLYKKVYTLIGLFILIIGLFIIPFIKFIIKDPPKIEENLILIYLLYLLDTVFSYFYSYKRSLLLAHQKAYLNNLYELLTVILKSVIQIIVLMITKNYILYLFIYVISTLATNILISKKADKLYPEIKNTENERLTKEEVKKIFSNVKSLILYKIGKTVNSGTDNIVISSLIGITQVGLYSNYSLIISAVKYAFMTMLNGFTGSVGNLNTLDDIKRRKKILEQLLFISVWIFGFASICLLILLKPFISLWIGSKYLLNDSVVLVIVLIFYIEGTSFIARTYRDTCGLFKEGRFAPLLGAILNITLSMVLGTKIGLIGIFLATVISMVTSTLWYNPYVIYKNVFQQAPTRYYLKYIIYTLVVFINYLVCNFLCSLITIGSIFGLIIKSLIVIIVSNLIFLFLFNHNKDFIAIKVKVLNVIRRDKMIIIRLDDAAEYMDVNKWQRVEDILDKYKIVPLVGVIPKVADPKMVGVYQKDVHFFKKVKKWEEKDWIIAMHGYDHKYLTNEGGINPKCSVSEFAGVPLEKQEEKIRAGIEIFNQNKIFPKVFFAPSHTFDNNTLIALKNNSNIRIISDTVSNDVYKKGDFYYIPQQIGHEANLPFKIVTICFHPNMMEEEDFINFENYLKNNNYRILKNKTEFENLIKDRSLSFYDKILNYFYLNLRRLRKLDK